NLTILNSYIQNHLKTNWFWVFIKRGKHVVAGAKCNEPKVYTGRNINPCMAIPGMRRINAAMKNTRSINPLARLRMGRANAWRETMSSLKKREQHLAFLNERREQLKNGSPKKTPRERQWVLDELRSIDTQAQQTLQSIGHLKEELGLIWREPNPKKWNGRKK
ncbi:MAG: hypothetical protein NUV67_05490, partial [archaeon]|nr:hypothetical protein [archaeon]